MSSPTPLRLEQADSYRKTFESRVTAVDRRENGLWVALEESCFYPESGGQPADTGVLAGWRVDSVQQSRGVVWHRLASQEEPPPGFQVGQTVAGEVDWPRRYRHMQRHSGQHLLSQAFVRLDPRYETRSVSLSGPVCTLDLAGEPSEDTLREAEALVNEVAYRNLPIRAFEVDEAELGRYALRREPKVSGRVRLVEMGDWELSACGGTHLRGTAEALPIKLLGLERVKSELVRVSFCAGLEALADYREKHGVATRLARAFSARVAELPERVAAVQDELRAAEAQLRDLHDQLAEHEAARLLSEARSLGSSRVVRAVVESDLQRLASTLCRQPGVIALLGSRQEAKAGLLFMRSAGVQADMNQVLRQVLPLIEGRGGGRPDRAQGGGSRVEGLEEALTRALDLLERA